MRFCCALLLLLCDAASALTLGAGVRALRLQPTLSPRRAAAWRMCGAGDAADEIDDSVYEGLEEDSVGCEGRIVTELKDVTGTQGALPDRFMMAVQAIRGEFSPPEDHPDNERQDDLILQALVNFPATVQVKVVSRAVPEQELDELVQDVSRLCSLVEGGSDASLDVVDRGSRRSIGFAMRVPDALALAELRDALMDDPRVQMVF